MKRIDTLKMNIQKTDRGGDVSMRGVVDKAGCDKAQLQQNDLKRPRLGRNDGSQSCSTQKDAEIFSSPSPPIGENVRDKRVKLGKGISDHKEVNMTLRKLLESRKPRITEEEDGQISLSLSSSASETFIPVPEILQCASDSISVETGSSPVIMSTQDEENLAGKLRKQIESLKQSLLVQECKWNKTLLALTAAKIALAQLTRYEMGKEVIKVAAELGNKNLQALIQCSEDEGDNSKIPDLYAPQNSDSVSTLNVDEKPWDWESHIHKVIVKTLKNYSCNNGSKNLKLAADDLLSNVKTTANSSVNCQETQNTVPDVNAMIGEQRSQNLNKCDANVDKISDCGNLALMSSEPKFMPMNQCSKIQFSELLVNMKRILDTDEKSENASNVLLGVFENQIEGSIQSQHMKMSGLAQSGTEITKDINTQIPSQSFLKKRTKSYVSKPGDRDSSQLKKKREVKVALHQSICQACMKNEAKFICAGCSNQWYCSQDCQFAAWNMHSEVCLDPKSTN